MTQQLELIPPETKALARNTDPSTSKDAAARVSEFGEGHCQIVLSALRRFGMAGAEQLGAATGLEPYSVRKRLADLQHQHLAEPTEQTRKTSSGRSERLWRAAA